MDVNRDKKYYFSGLNEYDRLISHFVWMKECKYKINNMEKPEHYWNSLFILDKQDRLHAEEEEEVTLLIHGGEIHVVVIHIHVFIPHTLIMCI